MRILVVEDYAPLRAAVVKALREAGSSVDESAEDPEGLFMASSGSYDVIVLDVMLPGLDGLSLLERLRVRSLADHQGSTRGTHAQLRQTVSLVGGKIVGDLDIKVHSGKASSRLETRVVLDETKLLVLGEAGFRPPADLWPLRTGTTNKSSTLFYVIQTKVTR